MKQMVIKFSDGSRLIINDGQAAHLSDPDIKSGAVPTVILWDDAPWTRTCLPESCPACGSRTFDLCETCESLVSAYDDLGA